VEQLAQTQNDIADIVGREHVLPGSAISGDYTHDEALTVRQQVIKAVYRAGMALGGAISGEHGIGSEKLRYFLELEQPAKIALMRRIKAAFDPNGILNPGVLLG
jgi:glycolate oxidase